jgi:hypothetical protein
MSQEIAVPERIQKLPMDEKGRYVPWFVAFTDGKPDFRCVDGRKIIPALQDRLCWICGQRLGRFLAFTIGPMCAINRISSEPPSHKECAIYACQVCPFLATPKMHRRERDLPEDMVAPAGISIRRNPGVVLIWITQDFQPIAIPQENGGVGSGMLFQVGEPTMLLWYCEGRPATRQEVIESIDSGLPLLKEAAELDSEPAESMAALERQYQRTLKLIPA